MQKGMINKLQLALKQKGIYLTIQKTNSIIPANDNKRMLKQYIIRHDKMVIFNGYGDIAVIKFLGALYKQVNTIKHDIDHQRLVKIIEGLDIE